MGALTANTTEKDLEQYFSSFGNVDFVQVIRSKDTGQTKGNKEDGEKGDDDHRMSLVKEIDFRLAQVFIKIVAKCIPSSISFVEVRI